MDTKSASKSKIIFYFLITSLVVVISILIYVSYEYKSFKKQVYEENVYFLHTKELYFRKIGGFYILLVNNEKEKAMALMEKFLRNLENIDSDKDSDYLYNKILESQRR